MEPLLTALIIAVVALAALGALTLVPFGRWTFEWNGHRVDIANHLFRETVLVDGRPATTRRESNGLTWAEHTLELDGSTLRIWIGTTGQGVSCRADDGARVIFQSKELPPPLLEAAPPVKVAAPGDDRRLVAARVLLGAVAAVDRGAAADLEQALVRVLAEEREAREAADAHVALGGTEADAGRVVEARARAVEEVMATLRALHLRVSGARADDDAAPALREAREALSRLDAAREVDDAARRAGAARRAAQRTGG